MEGSDGALEDIPTLGHLLLHLFADIGSTIQ